MEISSHHYDQVTDYILFSAHYNGLKSLGLLFKTVTINAQRKAIMHFLEQEPAQSRKGHPLQNATNGSLLLTCSLMVDLLETS